MPLAKDFALRIPPIRRLVEQRDELVRENAKLRAHPGTLAVRDDLQYVFIVTYGRSGSTLLQGILNSIPGYLVRGENNGTIEVLGQSLRNLNKRRAGLAGGTQTTAPWFGFRSYSPEQGAAGYRRFMLDVLLKPAADTRVIGFKEIRWWKRDLVETLEMTREIFPGARFVFNSRNVEDVIKSKWWAEQDAEEARAKIVARDTRMEQAYAALGDDVVYRIRYDDYIADPEVLRGLFTWLGEPFDRARIDEVLGTRHSF